MNRWLDKRTFQLNRARDHFLCLKSKDWPHIKHVKGTVHELQNEALLIRIQIIQGNSDSVKSPGAYGSKASIVQSGKNLVCFCDLSKHPIILFNLSLVL